MRKVQLLFVCLMLSAAAFAADKVVKLPKPNLNRTGTVMKALSERQSTREYASKALTLADLSDLLWAANGINRSDAGKRTAPSAMNKQDVDVYVILSEGSYLYDAKNQRAEAEAAAHPRPDREKPARHRLRARHPDAGRRHPPAAHPRADHPEHQRHRVAPAAVPARRVFPVFRPENLPP